MCTFFAQLVYCMPVDPYSLIAAARRYHGVRGAVIFMDFVKDRKKRNTLQTSVDAPPTTIANLPIEVMESISARLLDADSHKTRCDCWARYWKIYTPGCYDGGCYVPSCKSAGDECECHERHPREHCMNRCLNLDLLLEGSEIYADARHWQCELETLHKKNLRKSNTIEYWAAVGLCAHVDCFQTNRSDGQSLCT